MLQIRNLTVNYGAISAVRGLLPTDMKDPILQKFDPNALPIVSLVLSSNNVSPAELTQIADPGITKELRLPHIA